MPSTLFAELSVPEEAIEVFIYFETHDEIEDDPGSYSGTIQVKGATIGTISKHSGYCAVGLKEALWQARFSSPTGRDYKTFKNDLLDLGRRFAEDWKKRHPDY